MENQLESVDSLSPVDIIPLKNKGQLNCSRLAYFTEGSQNQKLEDMGLKWSNYLHTIPLIEPNQFIFGDHFAMINKTSLIDRLDLQHWWVNVQFLRSFNMTDILKMSDTVIN